MSRLGNLGRIVVAFVSLSAAFALLHSSGFPERAAFTGLLNDDGNFVAPEIAAIAPLFTLRSVKNHSFSLRAGVAKATIVTFWASWCRPCRQEMQQLQSIYESDLYSLRIIAINLGESRESVEKWVGDLGLTYDVMLDPLQSIAMKYGIRGLPTSFMLDDQLRIHQIYYGTFGRDQLLRDIGGLTQHN